MPERRGAEGRAPPASPLDWTGSSDKRSYYRLFFAYVIALFATGIATVALAVLAFDMAGDDSGAVLGTALSLKMLAYVVAAPLAAALTERLPRKPLLVGLDIVRAASLLPLPFVTAIWQVYVLIFVFALASATFTLLYQTIVPYLLRRPDHYAQSLSRSRIATELETSISPLLAAGLLLFLTAGGIFMTVAGSFILSAALVQSATIPQPRARSAAGFIAKVMRGPRLFVANAHLRGLIAVDVAVALTTAMVMVNTVVLVEGIYGLGDRPAAVAFALFGLGSIAGAVVLPLVVRSVSERTIMLIGGVVMVIGLALGSLLASYVGLLGLWVVLGLGVSLGLTPASFLIRSVGRPEDLQSLFAAQFSISNGCLLFAYPAAGWLGATVGLPATFIAFSLAAGLAAVAAVQIWGRTSRGSA